MALAIYNTLERRKELFEPLEPGRVRMYVCGVTVYDLCHIGHARALVVFDMINRYLRYIGYDVTYVRNITDVDDKIIERAQKEGVSYRLIADRYTEAFHRDFDRLGLQIPRLRTALRQADRGVGGRGAGEGPPSKERAAGLRPLEVI